MIFKVLFALSFITALLFHIGHASVGGYIGPGDKQKLLNVLAGSLIIQKDDLLTPYYGAKGFKLLNEPIVAVLVRDNCAHLQNNFKPDNSAGPEVSFHALSAWSLLGCKDKLHTDATITALRAVLENDKSTTADIRYALETLKLLNQQVTNGAKISQLLQAKLREDDGLQSVGHALHAASLLGNAGKFALDRVEEVVVQADEVDGKLLQWEGGLSTTSLLITGLYRLPGAKPLTSEQAEKVATYLLTRRTVPTPKGVLALVEAVVTLANSDVSPVSISVDGPAQVTVDKPDLRIHISDLLGRPLKTPLSPIVAQSATRIADDVVVLSKQPLSPTGKPVEYTLTLKLEPGQYRIVLTAGSHSTTIVARILGPVTVESLEIGLSDADGSSVPRLTKLKHPSQLPSPLQADSSQRLTLRFALSRPVHQTFLRLFSGKKEIVFVAEIDTGKQYKLDVNLASELAHSGTFKMQLILGDTVMSNPIIWTLGSIEVNLNTPEPAPKTTRGPKPEIRHLFRPAEKRPPEVVSLFFTGLTLLPLLILLIIWLRIGINFGNFAPLSIPFHVSFGSILGLFTLFWLKLNMFTTCAWLIPLGACTFLSGHKLLSHFAQQKK